jgi:hypothetical protein
MMVGMNAGMNAATIPPREDPVRPRPRQGGGD